MDWTSHWEGSLSDFHWLIFTRRAGSASGGGKGVAKSMHIEIVLVFEPVQNDFNGKWIMVSISFCTDAFWLKERHFIFEVCGCDSLFFAVVFLLKFPLLCPLNSLQLVKLPLLFQPKQLHPPLRSMLSKPYITKYLPSLFGYYLWIAYIFGSSLTAKLETITVFLWCIDSNLR